MIGRRSDRPKTVAMVVAHPDDETLWAGGTILEYRSWSWRIVALCRSSDLDRAPRFYQALRLFEAEGGMADLDDGPEQKPLDEGQVRNTIRQLLPRQHFDLIVCHDPAGEYTRHLRHEEVGRAVLGLWEDGDLAADELWTFAYEDGGKRYLPRAVKRASVYRTLSEPIWQRKYEIITGVYGFPPDGFEARTTPRAEAFWRFTEPAEARAWLQKGRGGS